MDISKLFVLFFWCILKFTQLSHISKLISSFDPQHTITVNDLHPRLWSALLGINSLLSDFAVHMRKMDPLLSLLSEQGGDISVEALNI